MLIRYASMSCADNVTDGLGARAIGTGIERLSMSIPLRNVVRSAPENETGIQHLHSPCFLIS